MKTEILYGIHPVIEALKANRRSFASIHISKDRARKGSEWIEALMALAEPLKVPIITVPSSQLTSMADTDMHQGVAAKVSPYPLKGLSEILGRSESATSNRFLLILDHVVDPHNFGALIRTAHCVDIGGILVPKDRSAPPTATVSKVSSGALEHVSMARVTNIVSTISILKENGMWVVGLDKGEGGSIFSLTFPPSVAIVIGGEHRGIRPLVKKHCDLLCSIPQAGEIDSLNASVAGGVAMYEVYRQRHQSEAS
ncbi:MAG: 23S rRNA (guanosine(2251)-2'-O)-methyltransferase RlmB [Desulfobacterales bacterium]